MFPNDYRLIWLVLMIVQNALALLVEQGPCWTDWKETVFSIYYILLFLLTGVIVHHFHALKRGASTLEENRVAVPQADVSSTVV